MSRNTRTRLGEFTTLGTTGKVRQIGGDFHEVACGDRGDRWVSPQLPDARPRRFAAPSGRLTAGDRARGRR